MGWMRLKALSIKLEFEKSYDCLKWPFILAMPQALCFGQFFFQVVETLFVGDLACLSINQTNSKEISLRQ